MLRVAIVEDETEAKEVISAHLKRYCGEKNIPYQLVWYNNGLDFLAVYNKNFDVVLLDIMLPDINGMGTARKLRDMDNSVALVFVTIMAQYAIKGYEVDAADFMVKPVSYYDFAMKFEHVLRHIDFDGEVKLCLNNKGELKYLSAKDIRYVEVIRHNLIYHTGGGSHETRGTLKKLEEQLRPADGFVRCNNYCLVNLRYVTGISGYELSLSTGVAGSEREVLQISHPRKKGFVTALNEYLREHV